MKINESEINAKQFAWDECHKIYLMNTIEDKNEFIKLGYDLFPIEGLREAYENSCSLKFISNGNVNLPNIVNQFEEAIFS